MDRVALFFFDSQCMLLLSTGRLRGNDGA